MLGPKRIRAGAAGEGGFMIVDLTVTTLVMGIAVTAIVSVMLSMMRNSGIQDARVDNQEQVRFAMQKIERDIRSANPMNPLSTAAAYANEIEVSLGATSGTRTYVRWQVTGTTLQRMILNAPGGTATSTLDVLTGVQNASIGESLFRYYNSNGNELTSANSQPADFSNCSIRVLLTLTGRPSTRASAFTEQSQVQIRNLLPGGIGC
jgi:hypothetical protein